MAKKNGAGGLALFVGALMLAALGQALVWQEVPSGGRQILGWALFALGGWLLKLGWRREKPQPLAEKAGLAWEAGALALIVALSIYLRLVGLGSYPNAGFRDEGENGNVAIQIMNGETVDGTGQTYPAYIEHNTQNAAGYFYVTAAFFKAFGVSITSVRYVSVAFGALSVLAFYFLARAFFGVQLGLFLTACLAAMRWHLNFSRIGFLGMMTVFFSLPMLVLLYKGLGEPAGAAVAPARRGRGRSGGGLFVLALALAVGRGLLGFVMVPGPVEAWLGLALGLPLIFFAVRGWQDRRSRWLMLAAVSLALAMYSYIAARLFVVLVALIVAHHLLTQGKPMDRRAQLRLWGSLLLLALGSAALVAASAWGRPGLAGFGKLLVALGGALHLGFWWLERRRFEGWGRPLGLALGVGLVVAGPLYSYSLSHQKEVAARSYRVSIFNDEEADKRPWGVKLAENLGPTMGMMNVRGDGNPRHNLPGEIMVNPAWAALFALGVFFALLRLRDPRAWLAMSLWQISLIAGYYSIEAPQAYRCISAIPAVLLFMGLALERGVSPLRRWLGKDAPLAVALLLLPLLAFGGGYELNTYFKRQPQHPGVWAEFSAGEYLMGKELKALNMDGHRTHGLVRPDFADSYTFRFMTYPERDYEYFDASRHVPLRPDETGRGEDFLYILGPSHLPLKSVLQSFYPHGVYHEERHPLTNELLYWSFRVDAAEAAKAGGISSGLRARYYQDVPSDPNKPWAGPHWAPSQLRKDQVDPFVLFEWTVTPVPGWYSVQWDGTLKAPQGGSYTLGLVANSYAEVLIDGRKVVERPFDPPGADAAGGTVRLSAGRHSIRVRYFEARNYSRMELWWTRPDGVREVIPSEDLSPR
jgi:hypothetical protein